MYYIYYIVYGVKINNEGIKYLCSHLHNMISLKTLDLECINNIYLDNAIENLGLKYFCKYLKCISNLNSLNISSKFN